MQGVLRSLLRRWYLTVVGLILAAGLGAVAAYLVPPTYEATGSVVLLPPKSTVEPGGNPYLQLVGLGQTVDVVSRAMMAQSAAATVKAAHPSATYTVAPDPLTSGPLLLVTVTDKSPEGAVGTLSDVMARLPAELASIQKALGYTGTTQITSSVLAKDLDPEVIRKSQLRAVIATVGAVLIVTVLGVALIDGLTESRGRGRRPVQPRETCPGANATDHGDDAGRIRADAEIGAPPTESESPASSPRSEWHSPIRGASSAAGVGAEPHDPLIPRRG